MQTLATKLRPTHLNDVVGQNHIIPFLKNMITKQQILSMIFFGPPGTGKTTLAKIIAQEANIKYHLFNAVTGSKKDLDAIFEETRFFPQIIIIIDEVHRLNKDKQDLLLPYVESGKLILIGATTSNPFFTINPAIRSRVHLLEIKKASIEDVVHVLKRGITLLQRTVEYSVLTKIAEHANGDIRYAINILEWLAIQNDDIITLSSLLQYPHIPNLGYDKNGDGHYDVISAFQKSIRGSDVNAALYYLAALIEANDHDAIYRRLSVCAYEDIGLANPNLVMRVAQIIQQTKEIGLNEGRLLLSTAVIELCLSPKSQSAKHAINAAQEALYKYGLEIPEYLKLTPVFLDEKEKYDYQASELWPQIQYLPNKLKDFKFYSPGNNPYEEILAKNYQKLSKPRINKLSLLKK